MRAMAEAPSPPETDEDTEVQTSEAIRPAAQNETQQERAFLALKATAGHCVPLNFEWGDPRCNRDFALGWPWGHHLLFRKLQFPPSIGTVGPRGGGAGSPIQVSPAASACHC